MSRDQLSPEPPILGTFEGATGVLSENKNWSTVRGWTSFSAKFWLFASQDHRFALKIGDNWTSADVEYLVSEIKRVRQVLAASVGDAMTMPAVLGTAESPPAMALEYLTGERLFDQLVALAPESRVRYANLFGRALGAYHHSEPAPDTADSTIAARDELFSAARRSGVRRVAISKIEPELKRARGFRFSPNDLLVDERGELILLDPPHVRKYDYIHRDVATFAMEAHRSIVGERRFRTDSERAEWSSVMDAFVDGYAQFGPSKLDRNTDRMAVGMFVTARVSGVALGRFRQGDVSGGLRASLWARWLRSQALDQAK